MKKLMLLVMVCFVAAMSQEQTVIKGSLLGHDGKPMLKGHVHVLKPGHQRPLASMEATKEGSFEIKTGESGILIVQGTGVNHLQFQAALIIEKPTVVEMELRLGTFLYPSEITQVKIMGDFNNFNFNTAREMERQPDGTFAAEFETTAEKFKYQVYGIATPPHSINGTHSEDYEYDGGGDYRSVLTPQNGKVRVIFDPKKLVRSDTPPSVRVTNNPLLNRIASIASEMFMRDAMLQGAAEQHRQAGKDMKEFRYDWSSEKLKLTGQIEAEKDPKVRQLLLLSYLRLGQLGERDLDAGLALRALNEIPPESPLWSASPVLLRVATSVAQLPPEKANEYMDAFLTKNPDRNVKGSFLLNEAMMAQMMGKADILKRYYTILVNEYGDTQFGQIAKARLKPELTIAVGKPVPDFSVAALEDSKKVYSKSSLKGKYYLLDFWAVWCGPCIAEMDNLHKAYERFKKKNFEILSLSFDPKPEDVVKFRNEKWKMPWLHSFVQGGFNSDLAKSFEVIGIPKPILVDKDGVIVATDMDLRGERLEKTLAKHLGE